MNGGTTPADVLMVVAWDDAPRKKLEEYGKHGFTILGGGAGRMA